VSSTGHKSPHNTVFSTALIPLRPKYLPRHPALIVSDQVSSP